MFAARRGHTATVNALVETHGANVDAVDRWGRTALMLATYQGEWSCVSALMNRHESLCKSTSHSRRCT